MDPHSDLTAAPATLPPPLSLPPEDLAKTAPKEVILTPEQALQKNKRLKGYAYVPETQIKKADEPIVVEGKRKRKPVVVEEPLVAEVPITPAGGKKAKKEAAAAAAAAEETPKAKKRNGKRAAPGPAGGGSAKRRKTAADPERQLMLQTKKMMLQMRLQQLQAQQAMGASMDMSALAAFNPMAAMYNPLFMSLMHGMSAMGNPLAAAAAMAGAAQPMLPHPALPPATPAPATGKKARGLTGTGTGKAKRAPATPMSMSGALPPMTPVHASSMAEEEKKTSRSNRTIRQPKTLADEQVEASPAARAPAPLRKCTDLLNKLMKHQYAWVFNTPVDTNTYKDYLTVVSEPMDLGTIKKKLTGGEYDTIDAFKDDVLKVWANAQKFNPPGTDVHVMAQTLKQLFEAEWVKVPLAAPKPKTPKVVKRKKNAPAEVQEMKQQITALKEEMNKLKTGGARSRIAALDEQPLSFHEKTALKDQIFKLPPSKLPTVLDIIKEGQPQDLNQESDEIEIDIDQLSIPTLRKLQRFVRASLAQMKKGKGPKKGKKSDGGGSTPLPPAPSTSGTSSTPLPPAPASPGAQPSGGSAQGESNSNNKADSDSSGSSDDDSDKEDGPDDGPGDGPRPEANGDGGGDRHPSDSAAPNESTTAVVNAAAWGSLMSHDDDAPAQDDPMWRDFQAKKQQQQDLEERQRQERQRQEEERRREAERAEQQRAQAELERKQAEDNAARARQQAIEQERLEAERQRAQQEESVHSSSSSLHGMATTGSLASLLGTEPRF